MLIKAFNFTIRGYCNTKYALQIIAKLLHYLANIPTIKKSYVSKPFIVTAVILLFIGSSIGSIWMMTIFGIDLPQWFGKLFQQHKTLQMNGFLMLLIMGIGYMIVPRFRNIQLPSVKFAYLSFFLVLASLISQLIVVQITHNNDDFSIWAMIMTLRLAGLIVFIMLILMTLRVKPKLLRLSDYFIALSVITLLIVNAIELVSLTEYRHSTTTDTAVNSLTYIELWLLFPIIMIYGIEYKTLPSFLGFIRPRKLAGISSLVLTSSSIALGITSILFADIWLFPLIFNALFFMSTLIFAISVYIFGGFDNTEILKLIQGEKEARYNFTTLHIRISFLFLFIGITMAILFNFVALLQQQQYRIIFYDLAIHSIAIGFIGITIALYLPLMLPPIIGKTINFLNFNKIPVIFVILSLSIRAAGDFILTQESFSFSSSFQQHIWSISLAQILKYSLGLSGWFVVAAMFVFVRMIHKSMNGINPQQLEKGK